MQVKSLAWRLTLPIIFVGVVMMGLGIAAAIYVHREYQSRREFITQQAAGAKELVDLVFTVRDVRYHLREFLLKGDIASFDQAVALEPKIRQHTAEASRYASTKDGWDLLARIEQGTNEVYSQLASFRDQPVPAMRSLVDSFVRTTVEPKLLAPTDEYREYKLNRLQLGLGDAERFDQTLIISLFTLTICGITAGVLWGLAVARGVGRSLVQLSVPIKTAAGQLNEAVGPLTIQTHWKYDDLPGVVDRMAEQIGDVIEQMRASQRRAERSEKLASAGQLAAGMAHELRNPLTSMKLLVQSARSRSHHGTTLSLRDLEILEEEIERLERFAATILDYARPPQVQFATFDLNEVVRRSAELMTDRFRRRGMRVDLRLPHDAQLVLGDASQLRQVMLNLLVNSLDAGLPGQCVTIGYGATDAGEIVGRSIAGAVCLEVRDEGPGLPKTLSDDIFDPFVSTKETGLGLGLSISRQIVEAHRGRIEAADDPRGGAVFRVILPLAEGRGGTAHESVAVAAS